jgi:hypothetical protein
LNLPDISPEEFRAAAFKLLGAAAFKAGMPHNHSMMDKQFIPLVKLLLGQEDRKLKGKWLELELQRLGREMKFLPPT